MRLLIDTHVMLWALAEPDRLSEGTRDLLTDGRNDALVSAASVWEVAIKRAAGKLEAPDKLLDVLSDSGFPTLPITAEHATVAGALPPHHRDPFDRMLVAQARVDALRLVTHDGRLGMYGVDLIEA